MTAAASGPLGLVKQALPFALALGIWFTPIPSGLTGEAWHLFAIFAAAIVSVIVNAFPLLTASLLAVAATVLTGTVDPGKAFAGFANASVLLATNVLKLEDISMEGGTLVTFFWLAVLFALSGQLNELGFMGYVGGHLTSLLGGVNWPIAYVVLLVLYVLMHYMFVSQSAQVLALFAVFLDVAVRAGVPASLMVFALMFASSYFSTITPQGRSQNVIFVGSNYLTQGELYRLGFLTTTFCLLVFLVIGTPWLLFVAD
jgi:DASS family divalent anion:Na+ symporter